MSDPVFLWPTGGPIRSLRDALRLTPVAVVEERLAAMFPSAHPVLLSSGRAALALALTQMGAGRADMVGVFPYASHCVLEAVSRVATPLAGTGAVRLPRRVVYHQWGYVQERGLAADTVEDAVDSLCRPGAGLCPGGGRFEIWSMPKLIGSTGGGVLWCRNGMDARALRELRGRRGGGAAQWMLRLASRYRRTPYLWWLGGESAGGRPSTLDAGEVMAGIERWDSIVADRAAKLASVRDLVPSWLNLDGDRLPPVVPVVVSDTVASRLGAMGIGCGQRHFERVAGDGARESVKVYPLPIHQEMPPALLARAADCIRSAML